MCEWNRGGNTDFFCSLFSFSQNKASSRFWPILPPLNFNFDPSHVTNVPGGTLQLLGIYHSVRMHPLRRKKDSASKKIHLSPPHTYTHTFVVEDLWGAASKFISFPFSLVVEDIQRKESKFILLPFSSLLKDLWIPAHFQRGRWTNGHHGASAVQLRVRGTQCCSQRICWKQGRSRCR